MLYLQTLFVQLKIGSIWINLAIFGANVVQKLYLPPNKKKIIINFLTNMTQLPDPIKIVVAENEAIILHALLILLRSVEGTEVIGTARNGEELLQLLKIKKPDIILMDINMPVINGIEATKIIDQKMPWVKVIALSMDEHPSHVKKMFRSGAKGFLLKNTHEVQLGVAIRKVFEGEVYISEEVSKMMLNEYPENSEPSENGGYKPLTNREIEIIQLLSDGLYTKEIAEKLFISDKTVERHKTNILKKLHLRNTAQLIKFAMKKGIIVA